MPAGKVHAQIRKRLRPVAYTLILLGVLPLALLCLAFPLLLFVVVVSILFYEQEDMWSPDLDEVGLTDNEGLMMKHFKLFGALLSAYWLPYAYLMRFVGLKKKGHRNFFSHFPYVGTAIRVVYQFWPLYFVPWYGATADTVLALTFLGVWWGLGCGDLWHYLADQGWIKP